MIEAGAERGDTLALVLRSARCSWDFACKCVVTLAMMTALGMIWAVKKNRWVSLVTCPQVVC